MIGSRREHNRYLGDLADFTRDLNLRLGRRDLAALARRTGLREETVRALLAGDGELMSWEVVSACLAAAGVDNGAVAAARDRWDAAEQALWHEWGDGVRGAFERTRIDKPAKVVEAHRAKVPWRRLTSRHPVILEPWTVPPFDTARRLPDPSEAADIRDFYRLLAELREWAGSPKLSEIERRSWGMLTDATISAMLQKDRWRTTNDRERVRVGYFAAACGLPEAEVARWVEAYEQLRHIAPSDDLARFRAEVAGRRGQVLPVQELFPGKEYPRDPLRSPPRPVPPATEDAVGHDLKPNPFAARDGLEFRELLRQYWDWAGAYGSRRVAAESGVFSHTTAAKLIAANCQVPLKQEYVAGLIRGCGGDQAEQQRWITAFRALPRDKRDRRHLQVVAE